MISVIAVGNSAGQSAGTTTSASTVSVTPTLPAGTASGDRVYVVVGSNNTTGAVDGNWTVLFDDTLIGSGAAGAGTGQRWLSAYYRDYDGVWTMPAFVLTSAAQNTQTVGSITFRKDATDTWNTPTISSDGEYFGTAGTAFTATTTAFAVTGSASGYYFSALLACSVFNDNVTMTSGAITGTNGFVSGTVTERVDGGSATGNDVSMKMHTCLQTSGSEPAGTLTHTGTLSAASQGGVVFIQQTVSPVKMSTGLVDTFNAGFPGSLWFNVGGSAAESGAVRVTHGVGPEYKSFTSNFFFDFTDSYASVEVEDYGNQSLATHHVKFAVASTDSTNQRRVFFHIQANVLQMYKTIAGAQTQVGSNKTLSLINHRWLRIRESGGTVFWDVSKDSLIWTNLGSAATPFPIIAVQPICECNADNTEASGSSALFDNFSVLPARAINDQTSVAVKRAGSF